jgi:hypothetical protein
MVPFTLYDALRAESCATAGTEKRPPPAHSADRSPRDYPREAGAWGAIWVWWYVSSWCSSSPRADNLQVGVSFKSGEMCVSALTLK